MRPLEGQVVLVTRPRARAAELVALLASRGAIPLVAPAVEVRPAPAGPLERAGTQLTSGRFEWATFTSRAAVEALAEPLRTGVSAGRLAHVAAVGDGTAAALRELGVEPELVPARFTTEALGRAFPRGAGRVLLARADIAPDGLEDALRDKGWTPIRVDAYRTRLSSRLPPPAARALREGRVDALTFTSASTVEGFIRMAGGGLGARRRRPRVACIGPVTARAARRLGLRVDAVASPHTIEGLVEAVERALRPRGKEGSN
jgi:uroporphyrinogen-III synthase